MPLSLASLAGLVGWTTAQPGTYTEAESQSAARKGSIMLYRPFGQTGEKVSVLGFGAMRLPVVDHHHDNIDAPRATEMIRYAIDHGVNYVDTAYPYHGTSIDKKGTCEPFLGEALSGGYREKVLLATKLHPLAIHTRADMDRLLEGQLKDLRTDHIDCYLLHGIGEATWAKFRDLGVIEFLDSALADGRIRYAGFSFHDHLDAFKAIVDAYDWSFCQIQYNYMDLEFQAGLGGVRHAAERGLGVIIMEPLKGGRLAVEGPPEVQALWEAAPVKRTPAEWGLRYVWDDPGVSMLLSGMSTMEQLVENLATADQALPGSLEAADLELIDKVRRVYSERLSVDCTACRYCMPCPAGIDIPMLFGLLNNASLYDSAGTEKFIYGIEKTLGTTADASDCTECGQCMEACPQGIEVPEMLKEFVRTFE
jgi:predicted aldo/keto reductase-like oxidoreductase